MLSRIQSGTLKHNLGVCALFALTFAMWLSPLRAALALGVSDDRYVTVVAAPAIFVGILFWDRKRIFSRTAWDVALGLPTLAIALSGWLVILKKVGFSNQADDLTLPLLTAVAAWAGTFILCYGRNSFLDAAFPFACLLLVVPVPSWVIDQITVALQNGSATVSVAILRTFGVPVFAQDTHLSLPGLELLVAPECSGIHSCLSLFLVTLVVSRIYLLTAAGRLLLIFMTIPLAILKNAIRISVIAALSAYVDHAYLDSPIHHYGGFVFTPLEIALIAGLLYALRRIETRRTSGAKLPSTVIEQTAFSAE